MHRRVSIKGIILHFNSTCSRVSFCFIIIIIIIIIITTTTILIKIVHEVQNKEVKK